MEKEVKSSGRKSDHEILEADAQTLSSCSTRRQANVYFPHLFCSPSFVCCLLFICLFIYLKEQNKTQTVFFSGAGLLQIPRKISVSAELTKPSPGVTQRFYTMQQSPNWSCPVRTQEEFHLVQLRYHCDGCGAPMVGDKSFCYGNSVRITVSYGPSLSWLGSCHFNVSF